MLDPETLAEPKAARRSRLDIRLWLLTAAFESALIVLSLLLGLWLTGWAQDQDEQRRVADMRDFIRKEISANRELVASDNYLGHHKRLQAEIQKVSTVSNPTREQAMPAFEAMMRSGIHLTPVDDSVWRSISTSDMLEHTPPEKVFVLSRTYRLQDDLKLINENAYQLLSRIPSEVVRGDPPIGAIIQLQLTINDLVDIEQSLIKQYDVALKSFES